MNFLIICLNITCYIDIVDCSDGIPMVLDLDATTNVPTGYRGCSMAEMCVNFANAEDRELPVFTCGSIAASISVSTCTEALAD